MGPASFVQLKVRGVGLRRGKEPEMSEQEREMGVGQPEEAEVEGHMPGYKRGEAEAPPDAGERSEEQDEEPDVEAHRRRK